MAGKDTVIVAFPFPEAGFTVKAALSLFAVHATSEVTVIVAEVSSAFAEIDEGDTVNTYSTGAGVGSGSGSVVGVGVGSGFEQAAAINAAAARI
ncbi:MAG: hypothetical protein II542_08785, partial [Bacteroidales bacterium]|nr:hypothetical protein [Bacteroidales bacterium]